MRFQKKGQLGKIITTLPVFFLLVVFVGVFCFLAAAAFLVFGFHKDTIRSRMLVFAFFLATYCLNVNIGNPRCLHRATAEVDTIKIDRSSVLLYCFSAKNWSGRCQGTTGSWKARSERPLWAGGNVW